MPTVAAEHVYVSTRTWIFLVLSLSPAFALCAMADKKDEDRRVFPLRAILIFRPSTGSGSSR
jgi:hypothetical protein